MIICGRSQNPFLDFSSAADDHALEKVYNPYNEKQGHNVNNLLLWKSNYNKSNHHMTLIEARFEYTK
ncbi:hypothetical protein DPMN_006361 [Dreissena polymorpha]|uniref:Uncharacterized protein n=1 Tax=Dreissena polymorpha TaxID=45954 RepID=A0A9D4RXN4_DREPO|nr:hypothetical protein DPMN_006361 [Dreissena polymorpha]